MNCVTIVATVLISVLWIGCASKMRTYRLTGPTDHNPGYTLIDSNLHHRGIFYSLPRTILTVDAPLKQRVHEQQDCGREVATCEGNESSECKELRGLVIELDLPYESATKIEAGDIKLASVAEPDPAQIFVIDVGPRALNKVDTSLDLTETALLSKGTVATQNEALKLGIKTAEFAIKLVPTAMKLLEVAKAPEETARSRCLWQAKKVKELHVAIRDAEQRRLDLLVSGKSTEFADRLIAALRESKEKYAAAFAKTTIDEGTLHCEVRPTSWDDAPDLYVLSKTGLQIKHPGCFTSPVFLNPPGEGAAVYRLRLQKGTSADGLSTVTSRAVKAHGDCAAGVPGMLGLRSCAQGLFYRVPVGATVSIEKSEKGLTAELLRDTVMIAQFGTTNALPPRTGNLFGGKADAAFYTATGGIKTLSTEGQTFDASQLDKLGDAAVDALQKRADELAAAKDKVGQLKREKELLELERDIAKLKKEIGQTP